MNLERLAYIVLKVVAKSERRQGQVRSILKQQGINLTDLDTREVGRFIESKKLGSIIDLPMGELLVLANVNAVNFVNKLSNMTFEQKLKLIYSELETLPDKKGELETILNNLGIEPTAHVVSEFVAYFKTTDHVNIVAESKDGYDIVLTQKGQDILHAPTEKPVQPNIHIQDNLNSIINIGGSQSGSFDSGVKDISNSASKSPSPTPNPKPNSPTGIKQTIQVILQALAIVTAIILAMWANGVFKQ